MKSPSKRCKIHYRRLRREGANLLSEPFSELIASAIEARENGIAIKDNVGSRVMPSASGSSHRLINNLRLTKDCVAGNMCAFTPGEMQVLLQTGQQGIQQGLSQSALGAYDIEQMAASKGFEYVSGVCYWLATGDHFYQIQHVSLQAKQAEEYFTWLLREKTKTIDKRAYIELISAFDRQQIGGDLEDISTIEIGGIAPRESSTPKDVEDRKVTKSLGERFAYFGDAVKVLETLIGPVGVREIMEKIPDEADLEVKVNIGCKVRKRKT
ncbi:MAG: hypothetical protein GDA47_01285, partial [Rhodospirillales bacterium]|nr:hypothetical protein [Rhodospirillales bacterium]